MMKNKKLYYIYQAILIVLYLGLMTFFVIKCLETGVESSDSSQQVVEVSADVVNTTVKPETPVSASDPHFQMVIRKLIGHYGFFVVLGAVSILLYLSITKLKSYYRIAIHFSVGFVFACISEFLLEGNTEGRVGSWSDVGIDFAGFVTLSIIIIVIYYILEKNNKKYNESV